MIREREQLGWQSLVLQEPLSTYSLFSGPEARTPILSLEFESLKLAREYSDALLEKGYLVEVIPSTRFNKNIGVIRILINISHSLDDYQKFLEVAVDINSRLSKSQF